MLFWNRIRKFNCSCTDFRGIFQCAVLMIEALIVNFTIQSKGLYALFFIHGYIV